MSIILFVGLVFFFIYLQRKLYERYALSKLELERRFDAHGIYPGSSVELELTLTNRKLLPLSWLMLEQWMPAALVLDSGSASGGHAAINNLGNRKYEFDSNFAVAPFQRVVRKYRLTGLKRGYFEFAEGVKLVTADMLGSVRIERLSGTPLRLAIYPRLSDARECLVPARSLQGDFFVNRVITEDPLMVSGLREYTGAESMRNIDWKATARHSEVLVKRFEHTADRKVILLLYLPDIYLCKTETDEKDFERTVEAAASIAVALMDQGIPAGFATNALCLAQGGDQPLLPGLSKSHREELLTLLASVSAYSRPVFGDILEGIKSKLPGDTDIAIIAAIADESLLAGMDILNGVRSALILLRNENTDILSISDNIDIYFYDGEGNLL